MEEAVRSGGPVCCAVTRRRASEGRGTTVWCVEVRWRCCPKWATATVVRECRAVSVQRGVGILRAKTLTDVCWWR